MDPQGPNIPHVALLNCDHANSSEHFYMHVQVWGICGFDLIFIYLLWVYSIHNKSIISLLVKFMRQFDIWTKYFLTFRSWMIIKFWLSSQLTVIKEFSSAFAFYFKPNILKCIKNWTDNIIRRYQTSDRPLIPQQSRKK